MLISMNRIYILKTILRNKNYDLIIDINSEYANKNNSTYFFLDCKYGLKDVKDTSRQNNKGHSISFRVRLAISLRFFDWM